MLAAGMLRRFMQQSYGGIFGVHSRFSAVVYLVALWRSMLPVCRCLHVTWLILRLEPAMVSNWTPCHPLARSLDADIRLSAVDYTAGRARCQRPFLFCWRDARDRAS